MNKTVYYFSGTGNSFAVARDISNKIDAKLAPLATLMEEDIVKVENDIIGIVYPLQDFTHPKIVEEFAIKLTNIQNKYIFAVCTYGIKPSKSLEKLDEVIKNSGGKLSSGFAVKMPQNGIGSGSLTKKSIAKDIANWKARVDEICKVILDKEETELETSIPIFNFTNMTVAKSMGSSLKFAAVFLTKGVDALRFEVGDKCIGCGVCETICSLSNVKLQQGRPTWGDNCANCFGCVDWCAQGAITLGGNNLYLKAYHHPEVTVEDISIRK